MEVLAVLLFIAWVVCVVTTSNTRGWWVFRVMPAIVGFVVLNQRGDTHGEVGGLQALANGVLTLAAMVLIGLSVVTLGYRLLRRGGGAPADEFPPPQPPSPSAIPPAYVVTRGDRPSEEQR
jgi:hypothetical protein